MTLCECGNFQPKFASGWSGQQYMVCKNCGRDEPDLALQFMGEMESEIETQNAKIIRLEAELVFMHMSVEEALEVLSKSPLDEADVELCIEGLNETIS